MTQPLDTDVHEYYAALEEEQSILETASGIQPVAAPPDFIAIRICTGLRDKIDLITLELMGGDTTKIINSTDGPWYWLLLDVSTPNKSAIERLYWAAPEDHLVNPPPGLWEMAKPLSDLWKPKSPARSLQPS